MHLRDNKQNQQQIGSSNTRDERTKQRGVRELVERSFDDGAI